MRIRRPTSVVGLVAVSLCAIGLATVVPGVTPASGTPPIAYPDLISVIPTGGFGITHPTADTKELDYTHIVYNAGTGPLDVLPTDYNPTTNLATGVQRLYGYDTDGTRVLVSSHTATDQFFYHIAHGHYHFPLSTFGLYDTTANGSIGSPVAVSPKNGFCLGDDVHLDSSLPHSPATNGYSGSTCTQPDAVRGISPGWGDRYDRADPGQAIDITGVPDGVYWFHSVVDPDHNFVESDTSNNTTDIKLRISGDSVTPISPLQSKGSFVYDTSAIVDGNGNVSTPALTTTSPGDLLVAFVSAMGTNQTATVSGGGLVWTRARRANAQMGTAEVWSAKAPTTLTNAVITSTLAIGEQAQTLSVFAIQGASGIGASAGLGAATGLPNVAVKTTKQGSWVMAVGNDPDRDVPHVSASARVMVHENVNEAETSSTFLEATGAPIVAAGTTVPFTHKYPAHDHWDMVGVEILPLATNDVTPPVITANVASNLSQDRATISWTTDEPSTSRVDYGTTPAYGLSTTTDAALVTQHVQEITGLSPSTTYDFQVVSADSQSNVGTKGPATFTTTAPRTTPPVFSNIRLTDNEPDQVIIAWNTDEPTDTQVSYGVTSGYGSLSTHSTTVTTTHFQLITNLQPSTVYHYRVDGADPYGNAGFSGDVTFQTPAVPPAVVVDKTVVINGVKTVTTPAFSTAAANEFLVAFVAADGPMTSPQTATVSGAGLTWTLDERSNGQHGTAEVWHAKALTKLVNAHVSSVAAGATNVQSLTVVAFTGAVGIGSKSATNQPNGAPHGGFSTVSPQSVAYGVGVDWDGATARTMVAGQTMVHQWVATAQGDTLWVQRLTANTGAVDATVNLADSAPTADRWNFAAVEIIRPISVAPPAESAPVISAVSVAPLAATSATIHWTTNVIATGQVRYGKTTAYGGPSPVVLVGVKPHSRVLTGLTPATTYHYQIVSADGVGSTSTADLTFTTPA